MVMMFAIEIANAVDTEHRDERNKSYAAIARKYKPQELSRFADLFAELVNNLERNPFQDFLGSMYMELGLGNDHAGQFFTPYHLCRMMAEISLQPYEIRQKLSDKGWIAINDPACGAGATLIAAAQVLHERGINYQQTALFIGQDLDQTVALMCYIQLSLIGCAGYVHIANTLTEPLTGDVLIPNGNINTWYTPMFFASVWGGRVFARWMDLNIRRMQQLDSRVIQTPEKPAKPPEAPPSKPTQKPQEAPPKAAPERRPARGNDNPIQLSFFD